MESLTHISLYLAHKSNLSKLCFSLVHSVLAFFGSLWGFPPSTLTVDYSALGIWSLQVQPLQPELIHHEDAITGLHPHFIDRKANNAILK